MAIAVRYKDDEGGGVAVKLTNDEAQVIYDILYNVVAASILPELLKALEEVGIEDAKTVNSYEAASPTTSYPESLKSKGYHYGS